MSMSSSISALKMPEGGAQAVMVMTVSPELEKRTEALWSIHADWIKKTHVQKGDLACLFYHVCKTKEVVDATQGPHAEPTGNITFTIVEFYASKAGLDNHFAMFHSQHECEEFVKEFGALMESGAKWQGHMYGKTLQSIAQNELPESYEAFNA